ELGLHELPAGDGEAGSLLCTERRRVPGRGPRGVAHDDMRRNRLHRHVLSFFERKLARSISTSAAVCATGETRAPSGIVASAATAATASIPPWPIASSRRKRALPARKIATPPPSNAATRHSSDANGCEKPRRSAAAIVTIPSSIGM